jgi:hypothetical protein
MKILTIALLALICCLSTSCVKEKFETDKLADTEYLASLAVPVGDKSITLKEIFAEQLAAGKLIEDKDGLLWFEYKSDVFSLKASDFLVFPEFMQSKQIKSPVTIDLSTLTEDYKITDSIYIELSFPGMAADTRMDSIYLNNYDLGLSLIPLQTLAGSCKVSFPMATYGSLVYSKNISFNSNSTYKDFAGYTVKLVNDALHKNSLLMVIETTLHTKAQLQAGSTLATLSTNLKNLDYYAIFGYFGKLSFDTQLANSIVFDFWNRKLAGYFQFTHPAIEFTTINSFGIPFSMEINKLSVQTSGNQSRDLAVQGNFSSATPAMLDYPKINELGQSKTNTASIEIGTLGMFSKDYSTAVNISMRGKTNPAPTNAYNFILNSSKLDVKAKFSLPFWGNTDNLVIEDTMAFDLNSFYRKDFDLIKRLLFILNFRNRFPVEAQLQVYFANASGTVLDSMLTERKWIKTDGQFDASSKIIPYSTETVKAALDRPRIDKIRDTKHLKIRVYLSTINFTASPQGDYKFFSDYYLYTHIGVAADISK